MPFDKYYLLRTNSAGQHGEAIVPAVFDSFLALDSSGNPVFIPKSDFASATALSTLTNSLNAHAGDLNNPHAVTKSQVGLANVLNVAQIPATEKGANGGVATLDSGGKVPTSQLPATVIGGLSYQTTWNASTNTPAIPTAAAGNKGWYYKVNVAGTTDIDGINDWGVGDWIVSDGSSWGKIDNTDQINSVNGQRGVVVITAAGLGAQAQHANLSAVSGLTFAANKMLYLNGSGVLGLADLSAVAVSFLAATTVELQRAALGISGARVVNAVTASADYVVALPASGSEFDQVKYHILASGADRNLKFHASIIIPSGSTFNNAVGYTILSGKKAVVMLECFGGTSWGLVTNVGCY